MNQNESQGAAQILPMIASVAKLLTDQVVVENIERPEDGDEENHRQYHAGRLGGIHALHMAIRAALKVQPATTEARPLHEEIVREGGMLVCTACGTTTAAPTEAQGDEPGDTIKRIQRQNMQGMADCMDMVHGELIEAGIIDKKTPPMMITNAVCAYIQKIQTAQGDDSARLDAAHARLLAATKVYSYGYMQDEAADEEDCVCGAAQHAEAKEVFAAIAAVERASAPQPQEQS